MPHTAALVLASGQECPMGSVDPPLLQLGGWSMLAWVIDAIGVADIASSANGDPARFSIFGCPIQPDAAFAGQGPLAGLLAGLDRAATIRAEALLTAPGNTSLLSRGFSKMLHPAPCAAPCNGRKHHLVALWPTCTVETLRAMLLTPGPRRIEGFAARIRMRYHDFGVRPVDPFVNVNTMSDLEQARVRANEMNLGSLSDPDQGTQG